MPTGQYRQIKRHEVRKLLNEANESGVYKLSAEFIHSKFITVLVTNHLLETPYFRLSARQDKNSNEWLVAIDTLPLAKIQSIDSMKWVLSVAEALQRLMNSSNKERSN